MTNWKGMSQKETKYFKKFFGVTDKNNKKKYNLTFENTIIAQNIKYSTAKGIIRRSKEDDQFRQSKGKFKIELIKN